MSIFWRQTSGFREQIYLERVMAMDAPAKEVKLFGLGPWLLKRYKGPRARLIHAQDDKTDHG